MPSILFSYPAVVFDFNQPDPGSGEEGLLVEDLEALKSLDGLRYEDEIFSEYLLDGTDTKALAQTGVSGGTLSFGYDAVNGCIVASTEYNLSRKLTEPEIATLKNYTVGQWADGIGSNFFQERMGLGLAPQVVVMDASQVHVLLNE